jgi:hypothetical protein
MRIERLACSACLAVAMLAACADATDPVDSSTRNPGSASLASTSTSVDPGALTPAPPPTIQAECRADGRWIICHTMQVVDLVGEPEFELPCGTLYETSHDVRHGIRWYDATDSVIVKRHVRQNVDGTVSLSPQGAGPVVDLTVHANWYDDRYADPLDLDSGVRNYHGEFTLQAPGFGVIAHIAGLDQPDGTHRGTFRDIDDPSVAAKLCAALTQ